MSPVLHSVMPAQAGISPAPDTNVDRDPSLRWNDEGGCQA